MTSSESRLLRLIALFKFFKATILMATGIGILRLMHNDAATTLDHWFARLGLAPGNRFVDYAISKAANIPPNRIKELGLGSFVYAALFLTEGIGLWMLKHWAEWFTVVITASLVPLEAWEIYRHPTIVKTLVLLFNIAVVAYLLYRLHTDSSSKQK